MLGIIKRYVIYLTEDAFVVYEFGQVPFIIIIIKIIIIFISSTALSKIRRAAGTCHSVLTKRCAFRRRA